MSPFRFLLPFVASSVATLLAFGESGCSKSDTEPGSDGGADGDGQVSVDGGGSEVSTTDPCAKDNGEGAPELLECTGLFASTTDRALGPRVRAYTPGVTFWSDGAEKFRWVALPEGTTIDATLADEWQFPEGTKFWKEFRVGGKKVETRFMWKNDPKRWTFAVYRWNDAETSAVSIPYGERNVNGTTYEIAATAQCEDCHGGRRDRVLGFEEFALGLSTAKGVTMKMLVDENLVSPKPPTTSWSLPEDATGKAAPALAFLHMNCGTSCHNENGRANASFTKLYMKLRAEAVRAGDAGVNDAGIGVLDVRATDVWTTALGATIQMKGYETSDWKRITAGDPDKSLVVHLAEHRGDNGAADQMPPVGTHQPDVAGVAALKAWIAALPK
ncbi:MAG: hypothetical protein U0169_05895 [Polyangiaceae bacterium]